MIVLQNPHIRNSVLTFLQGFVTATILAVIILLYDFLFAPIIVIVAALGLQSWKSMHYCYVDYITSAEAPIATIVLLMLSTVVDSLLLSTISVFLILFMYHYFFSPPEMYSDIHFAAFLFSIASVFLSMYIYNSIPHITTSLTLYTGLVKDKYWTVVFTCIICLLYFFIIKLKYELSITSVSSHYSHLLGLEQHLIHFMTSILKAAIATIVILLIGWLGAFITSISSIRKLTPLPFVLVIALYIGTLSIIIQFINPIYIVFPLILFNFFYVFAFAKRLPCSN